MYSQQKQTMTDQVLTFGSSLAKFIAVETAESVLSEDWPSIELFVQDTIARQDFNYLIIVDHDGVIRGSNNPEILQSQYNKPTDSEPVSQLNTVIVSRHVFTDNEEVLDFDTPILFQNTEIGRVHLGLPIAPLERVANQIVVLLTILLITTIIAVVVVVYILGKLTATPLATLLKGINEISHGHFSYRIAVERKDEFGQVFNKFDNMAEALQKQDETRALEQSELNQENKQRHSA
ncbi:MAG: HAMP domain-containing protein, partial [Gammaproteobacteria bacterium]|nr:HAMP domain-containing protein [Gammaproteobacteria bacterium]